MSCAGAFQPDAPALVFGEAIGLPSCFCHAASQSTCLLCDLSNKGAISMDITTIVRTLTPLTDAFEFYSIPYYLTGSLAISVYAVKAQAVQGIEVVADIKFRHVSALVVQLEKTYNVTEIAIRGAIEQRGSFMLVHQDTLQTIGVTLPAYRAYSQVKQEQAHRHTLDQGSRLFRVASPEDTILLLLEHYKGGGQRTQRLWETILEILTEQGVLLDLTYLRLWATVLDVTSLLEHALVTAGLSKA